MLKAQLKYFYGSKVGYANNLVTYEGMAFVLRSAFNVTSGSLYTGVLTPEAGLIDNAGFVEILPEDRYSNHPGWVEFTGYTGSRPVMTYTLNPTPTLRGHRIRMLQSDQTVFSITATGVLRGAIIALKSSNTGVYTNARFLSLIEFPSPLSVSAGSELKLDYTFTFDQEEANYKTSLP